jgi:hypothetical protein
MVYHVHEMGISKPQQKKLLAGHPVLIPYAKLNGDVKVYLNESQLKKLNKAIEHHKDYTLEFTAAQIKHHHDQEGSGFFGDLLKTGLKAAAPALANAAGSLASKAGTAAVNYGINKLTGSGEHTMPDLKLLSKTKEGIDHVHKLLHDHLKRVGRGSEHYDTHKLMKTTTGRGTIGNILSGILGSVLPF